MGGAGRCCQIRAAGCACWCSRESSQAARSSGQLPSRPASAEQCAGAAGGFPGLPSEPASPPPAGPTPCAMAGCAARVPPGSEARLSLATFLLGASVLALPLLTRAGLQGRTGLALYVAGLNALLLLLYRPPRYQVRAGQGLGSGLGRRGLGAQDRDRPGKSLGPDWSRDPAGKSSGRGRGRAGVPRGRPALGHLFSRVQDCLTQACSSGR